MVKYNSIPTANNQAFDLLYGQSGLNDMQNRNSSYTTAGNNFVEPGPILIFNSLGQDKMVITDQTQHRVLIYNQIIDDAAEALGSFFQNGRHLGTSSFTAAFSFNGNKILTTGGGGMIITDDSSFAHLLKHLSTTAKTNGLRYEHDQLGYNYRMVNILAALGVSQLKQLPTYLLQKSDIYNHYKNILNRLDVEVYSEAHCKSNNWIVNAVFKNSALMENALSNLIKLQIQARPLWTPAHRLNYFSNENTLNQTYPNAEDMWKRTLSLPSSSHLTLTQVESVTSAIRDAIS